MKITNILQKGKKLHDCAYSCLLQKTLYKASIVEEEPLDDLSKVLCTLVQETEQEINNKKCIGLILGFSLIQDKEHYYDPAEANLYNDLLALVESRHLIEIDKEKITLTELGRLALEKQIIYSFHSMHQYLYEHRDLKHPSLDALELYPFGQEMGWWTSNTNRKAIEVPEQKDVRNIILSQSPRIGIRLNLHAKKPVQIYQAEKAETYGDDIKQTIQIALYLYRNRYYPIVINGERVAEQFTAMLYEPVNEELLDKITTSCRFQYLWADRSAKLDFSTLSPFWEWVDYEQLAADDRVVWEDDALFTQIASNITGNGWVTISQKAPWQVLKHHLNRWKDHYYWTYISDSSQADDCFLLEHFNEYPWDLEVISQDDQRPTNVIEQLLLQKVKELGEWDWSSLKERLSKEFILGNLDLVDVDLAEWTEDSPEIRTLMAKYPDKSWDWIKVASEFNLDYLLEYIEDFATYIPLITLFDRVFVDEQEGRKYAKSQKLRNAVKTNKLKRGVLFSQLFNDKPYKWSYDVIDCFTELGLIEWAQTMYYKGFESNKTLTWTFEFFERYHHYVTTPEGATVVSQSVDSAETVRTHRDFIWDWSVLSANKSVMASSKDIADFAADIKWEVLIPILKDGEWLEQLPNIDNYLKDTPSAWTSFSKIVSLSYLKAHWIWNWDWTVLTARLFDDLEQKGKFDDDRFIKKWNWTYLSENLKVDYILNHLDTFIDYWDWKVVLNRIINSATRTKTAIVERIIKTLNSIVSDEARNEGWKTFTQLYNLQELKVICSHIHLPIHWDISELCQKENFDIFEHCFILSKEDDWTAFSSSAVVEEQLSYNKKSGLSPLAWNKKVKELLSDSKLLWDFHALSHLSYLNKQEWFIDSYSKQIDWDYISEHSDYFAINEEEKIYKRIKTYESQLNFERLSTRGNIEVAKLLKRFPDKRYDFNDLIDKGLLSFNLDLYDLHKKYDWNWPTISRYSEFNPDAQWILENLDKPFDWAAMSQREELKCWTREVILKIAKKPEIANAVNWVVLSRKDNFPVDKHLVQLPLASLDWKSLSSRKDIIPILDLCTEYIDWGVMSENKNFNVDQDYVLNKHKEKLDWNKICRRKDFKFSAKRLRTFAQYINWTLASASEDIEFSVQLLQEFKERWDGDALSKNRACKASKEIHDFILQTYINQITFLSLFKKAPRAYHITHLSNAISIIQKGKLESRNKASGHFTNSAGNNVHRRHDAHKFARFYFRPQSPTQFYNECLGKKKDDYYFSLYTKLGSPKCPLPVFFVFDIQEALQLYPERCYYSTGNMQSDWAKIYKVIEDPNQINAKGIEQLEYDKNALQQEFLVQDEVDLTKLTSLQIICFDENVCRWLRQAVVDNHLAKKITFKHKTPNDLFHGKNYQLIYEETDTHLKLDTPLSEGYHFLINFSGCPPSIDTSCVIRQDVNKITVAGEFTIKKDVPYEIYFEDERATERSWLIYNNHE